MKVFWSLMFCLLATCGSYAQQSDFAVEVGAFAERVPLSYFKIAGAYESIDQNKIYRYYIDVPSLQDAEVLRQKAIKAGHVNARVIDFNFIREQCELACGYSPRQKTSDKTSAGSSTNNSNNINPNTSTNAGSNKKPLRITNADLYIYWSSELKKRGIKIDTASLFAFWKTNREEIGMDKDAWLKLFERDLTNKVSSGGIKITNADLYIYWSSELKKRGIKIDSASLFAFWNANREEIGMDKDAWLQLFERDLKTYITSDGIKITHAELFTFWSKELKKKGIAIDSASLMAFWAANKDKIGLTQEDWLDVFKAEISKKPLLINNADLYIFWSNELRRKGIPLDSASLAAFWESNKDKITMSKDAWIKLFGKIELLMPTNLKQEEKVQCIFFDFGSASLRDLAKAEMNKLTKILNDNPVWSLEIAAHADGRGSAEANKKMSLKRANAARKYLIYKGINSNRISMKYYGKDLPIARNEYENKSDCEAGRQLNRRVEFYVFNANGNKMDIVLPIIVPENLRY